jgi:hypothetical protein
MITDDHPTDKTPNVPATPEPAGQPGAGVGQGRQAGAAARIIDETLTYAEEQWDQIRTVFRDELDLDADQTWCPITPVIHKSLRSCIEAAVSQYYFQSAATRRRRRRAELSALRKDIKNLRPSIISAIAVPVDRKGGTFAEMLLPGVDADMLTATRDYFNDRGRSCVRCPRAVQPALSGGRGCSSASCGRVFPHLNRRAVASGLLAQSVRPSGCGRCSKTTRRRSPTGPTISTHSPGKSWAVVSSISVRKARSWSRRRQAMIPYEDEAYRLWALKQESK